MDSDNPLINISYGRVLSKLGHSDLAYEIFKNNPSSIKKEDHFFPLNLAILHSHYEAPIMEKMDSEYYKDALNYSYFLRGLKQKLIKNKVDRLISNLLFFELPSGEELLKTSASLNHKLLNIRGWLSPSESSILYYFASKISKNNLIVEIGSFYGRSTICLGLGSVVGRNSKIIAVDPHIGIDSYNSSDSYSELSKNLKNFKLDNVSILREESLIAAKNHKESNIGLLFIDALHDYDNVKADFWNWENLIVKDGYILFHDAMLLGVNEFLIELLNDKKLKYQALGFRDSILVLKKMTPNIEVNIEIAKMLEEYGGYHKQWIKDDKDSIIWRIKYLLGDTESIPNTIKAI